MDPESDTIETLVHMLTELPPIREELVSQIRVEINENRYETPEKLDIAIERLSKDLW